MEMLEIDIKPNGGTAIRMPAHLVANALLGTLLARQKPATPTTPPRIGQPWPGQGGIYVGMMRGQNGAPDYHLIAPDSPAAMIDSITWGGIEIDEPGATSDFDGQANTATLIASNTEHPAAEWAAGVNIDSHTDYYLPARRELRLCWVNTPELFPEGYYWSSTQYSARTAWLQFFDDGNQLGGHKDAQYAARAVRRVLAL